MSTSIEGYPKVSVIISTYNRPAMIGRALASLHKQTFTDFEVIVVDDFSDDPEAYEKVLQEWAAALEVRDIGMTAYRNPFNSGYQCYPKNRGIGMAAGDYIAYLDDDNEFRPDHLQVCVDAIEQDFSTDMVYSRMSYICDDEESREALRKQFDGETLEGDAPGMKWQPERMASLLSERNYIDTSTILHSKGAFYRLVRESGYGWDEALRRKADHNLVWRWASHGLTGKMVDKVTVDYHWHKGSLQLTRPEIEVPVVFNYSQYLAVRKYADEETGTNDALPKAAV